VERVLAKEELSVIVRFFETISKALPSLLSVVWLVVEVSSVSQLVRNLIASLVEEIVANAS
jgi:hypothetical protein